ncbi:hypothetical protein CAEBREN_24328 [Caenorhabditis brenneri]|uniref:Cyclin N-terminal domain-containing protein n=1 Tax=Caenorhabditis brenneri TaxID=135651 RepID=G0NRF4_CAEBE|nr:hypothetical protein CAEBREN_24328 [Caenorhabditis brenneri]
MIGRTTLEISSYSRRVSTETILSNSQSPSFVTYRTSPDSNEEKTPETTGLSVRNVQKRQKPVSPRSLKKSTEPQAKKFKEVSLNRSITHTNISNYCLQTQKNEKRLRKHAGLSEDMLEMYTTLSASVSLIPIPHTLLQHDNKSKCTCSIEDRKRVLLNVFSRRFSMKVSSETLHLGAALLDKCLDVMSVNKGTLDELAAVTIAIASKVEDVNCLTLDDLIVFDLIKNKPISMIASLERFVLVSLSFRVTIPTPFHFANYMLVHFAAAEAKRNLTYYFLELSILYVHNRGIPSDAVAHAATCLAFVIETKTGRIATKVLREMELELRIFMKNSYSTKRKQSHEAMKTMADLFVVASSENHAIFREYSTSRRNFVALRRVNPDLQEMLRMDSS